MGLKSRVYVSKGILRGLNLTGRWWYDSVSGYLVCQRQGLEGLDFILTKIEQGLPVHAGCFLCSSWHIQLDPASGTVLDECRDPG